MAGRRTAFVALLRGVNVGGRKVPMADLRSCLAGLGYEDVRTYIQSGNAVFRATGTAAAVRKAVEAALQERFGMTILTVVLTAAELDAVVAENPFVEVESEPTKLVVSFLPEAVSEADRKAFSLDDLPERGEYGTKVLYLHYPDGQGVSKLTPDVLQKRTGGIWGTARNWRTVLALQELAHSPATG